MIRIPRIVVASLLTLVMVPALLAQAPKPGQTATEFYRAYRVTLAKAASIEDLLPLLSKDTRARVEKTPAAERPMMFNMVKEMALDMGDVTVLKETAAGDGVELQLEATSKMMNGKQAGKVQIIKEDGAWKVGRESWGSGR